LLGAKRLDAITSEAVQGLKQALGQRAPKTVNNVLTVLNKMLKTALEWDVLDRMPCTIRLLPLPKGSASFHDFDEYERLVEAAKSDVNAAATLRQHRHLRSNRVLCSSEGSPLTQRLVQGLVARAARRANLRNVGVHVLRHRFCSHLAMRGAGARAIQELAGHRDLSTNQRYMHVSPAAVENVIRLLDSTAVSTSMATLNAPVAN